MDSHIASGSGMTRPDIFDEFESYRFSDDPEFRAGLPTVIAAIRGKDRSATQIDEMIGRAQWFYFTRLKGVTIPWEDYARRQITHPYVDPSSPRAGLVLSRTASPSTPTSRLPKAAPQGPQEALQTLNYLAEARTMMKEASTGDVDGGEGLSFAMLSKLIAEGRTEEVPIKQIPEGTNDALPSQPQMKARPKPWETANHQPPAPFPIQPQSFSPTIQQHPYQHNYASSSKSSSHSFENSHPPQSSASAALSDNTYFGTIDYQPAYASYDPSPESRPWASVGPTISPDLSLENKPLDPDLDLNLTNLPEAAFNNDSGTTSAGTTDSGFTLPTGQFNMSALTSNSSLGLDDSFDDFLNTDFDPDKPNSDADPLNLAPPIGQASISTSATRSTPRRDGQTSD